MEGKNNTVMLTIIGIATLLIAVVGATFAYFSAILSGQETSTTVTIKSGAVGTVFDGGAVISVSNIYPENNRIWATKKFSISSSENSNDDVTYTATVEIDSNSFSNGALKYTLTHGKVCSNILYEDEATCIANEGTWQNASTAGGTMMAENTTQTSIPVSGSISLGTGTLPANTGTIDTHAYELNIYFPDTGIPQDEEQGQVLQAHIVLSA